LVSLTPQYQQILRRIAIKRNAPSWLTKRAKILLSLAEGVSVKKTAQKLETSVKTVRRWLDRWHETENRRANLPDEPSIESHLIEILKDKPRDGRPPVFSAQQVVAIVAIACESPERFNRPVTHWTPTELVDEAIKQRIVDQISPRSVGRFLKSSQTQTAFNPLLAESKNRGLASV